MGGQLILGAVILLALGASGHAEEEYTVSGDALFSEGDAICITLLTHSQYMNYKNKPLPPPPFTQIIELTPDQKKAGRVPFQFTGIPRGTYGLAAFRGPAKAPRSSYKLEQLNARWDDIKIDVNRDIRNLKIKF